jgi:hypothetical protein
MGESFQGGNGFKILRARRSWFHKRKCRTYSLSLRCMRSIFLPACAQNRQQHVSDAQDGIKANAGRKHTPVLAQRLLHDSHRYTKLRLHIPQERGLRFLGQKRIDPLHQLEGCGLQGSGRRTDGFAMFAVVLYHGAMDRSFLALVVVKTGQGGSLEIDVDVEEIALVGLTAVVAGRGGVEWSPTQRQHVSHITAN